MAKEVYFFTTKDDLLEILNNIEQTLSIKYIQEKNYSKKDLKVYNSLLEYDCLGINKSGEHQSESFFILGKDENPIIKKIQQFDGSTRYFIAQDNNPDSLILWPGGLYDNKYLICGHIGTISNSDLSKKMFRVFEKYIKKQCKNKVGRFYISDSAKNLQGQYRLITINISQPVEYDVKF